MARGPKTDKFWADAIRLAAFREEEFEIGGVTEKRKRINIIAEKVVKAAMDGDMSAIQEVGNRIDGKPAQSIEADVTGAFNVILRGDDAEL